MDLKKLKRLYELAERTRGEWESLMEECYDYALPNRRQFRKATQAGSSEGDRNTDHIYDNTAVVGVQEFASRLQYNMMPPFARWARLVAGNRVPEEDRDQLQEELDQVTEEIFNELSQSTFDQDVNEAFQDLAVSQGHLLIEKSEAAGEIMTCKSVPLSNVFVTLGADGQLKGIFYLEVLKGDEFLEQYGDDVPAKLRADLGNAPENKDVTLIDAFVRTSGSIKNPVWERTKFTLNPDEIIGKQREYRGAGSSPWIVFRWSKGSGETYGRGPLLGVLPAIRSVNALMEFILEAAEWAVGGAYQADDDGVINPETVVLEPRQIIPRQPGSKIEPIQSASDFNVGLELVSHLQDAIKKGLYNERLGPREGTPPTATEVQQRMLELARDIGASFGRLQAELGRPVILRVAYLLDEAGIIRLPRVDGRIVDMEIQSPLAQAQRIEDVQNLARFGEQLHMLLGPQMPMIVIEAVEAAMYLSKRLMVPAGLVRDKQTVEQMLQKMLEGMQQMNEQQNAQPPQPTLGAA